VNEHLTFFKNDGLLVTANLSPKTKFLTFCVNALSIEDVIKLNDLRYFAQWAKTLQ